MSVCVFIDGEVGTTGLQIKHRLAGRTDIERIYLEDHERKDINARTRALNECDVAILCLPDAAAQEAVSLVSNPDVVVIDASSAHRTNPEWVYGFPEMDKLQPERISHAKRISNPGCYPQGVIAFLRPMIIHGLLDSEYPINVHAISGYSGGGRQKVSDYEDKDSSFHDSVFPYALTLSHKHVPEMQQYSSLKISPIFQPSIASFRQGMITMIPIHCGFQGNNISNSALFDVLNSSYEGCKHIHLHKLDDCKSIKHLDAEQHNDTNEMSLYVFSNDRGHLLLAAVYDNLGKGASGAAVQNLDLLIEQISAA